MTLLFVSDLDGTLLDHSDYSFAPALPALNALREREIPLVLATSKTAAEVVSLQSALGLTGAPAIVENGAGIVGLAPASGADDDAYAQIRAALDGLPNALRGGFRGFGDMTDRELSEICGLPEANARLARMRRYSEPGLWGGSEHALSEFLDALCEHGISARHGGRFLTLSFGRTKGDAVTELAASLGARKIIALGDAPNDAEMLEAADLGFIVRNDHGNAVPALKGEAEGRIRRTDYPGPEGWRIAVLGVLAECDADPDLDADLDFDFDAGLEGSRLG